MVLDDFPRPPNRRGVTASSTRQYQADRYESYSPPLTPPSQARKQKSPQSLNIDARPSYPQTFLDDTTPVEYSRPSESGDEQDPHDLALSPKHVTRTSVVDNMLLSLDQFVPGSPLFSDIRFFGGSPEVDHYSTSRFSDQHGRVRGHTYSSSASSVAYAEDIYDYPHIPRSSGQRSNNGTAFQFPQRRYDNARSVENTGPGYRSRNYDTAESSHVRKAYSGHSIRQGSKDSVSSTEYDPTIDENCIDYNERRSSSLDYGSRPVYVTDSVVGTRSPTDDLEAAPTPTVPAGPRRDLPPEISGVPANFPPPRTPAMSRRNSTKSSKSTATRKGRSETLGTSTIKYQEPAPPLPSTFIDPSAPSPTVSYQKPVLPSVEPTPVKEKPGFFRRVFGGSSKTTYDQTPIESPKQPTKPNVTPTSQPHQDVAQPVVAKKPSFFRRRKKSVVDHTPPPLVLAPGTLKALDVQPEPSPVSSLRQVMDPYLADGLPSPHKTSQDQHDDVPENFARNGHFDSEQSFLGDPPQRNPARPSYTADGTGKKGVLKDKHSLNLQIPSHDHDGTFLVDSSGNEAGSSNSDKLRDGRPKTSQSLTRDNLDHGKLPRNTSKGLAPPLEIQSSSFLQANSSIGSLREESPGDPNMSASEISQYHTASNSPMTETPAIAMEGSHVEEDESQRKEGDNSTDVADDSITAADRELARKLFDDHEEIIGNEPAAAWLGSVDRASVRKAYMDLFNWTNMDILSALRSLCTKMALKGETQQVDRVLDSLSSRWFECNPNNGFKAVDVVHTICYSLLLLNTDLHLADIEQKMTKSQFVRNTLPTINRVASDAAPDGFETIRPTTKSRTPLSAAAKSPTLPSSEPTLSNEGDFKAKRSSVLVEAGSCGPLVNTPFQGTIKAWEAQIEVVLKDFYNSIQKQRLPLYNASSVPEGLAPPTSGNVLRRSPSVLSKTGSDIIPRGRSADSRITTSRWSSKPRSRARLYPASNIGSSRTSLDDQSSIWSPSGSSTWSKNSLGKTLTSMSVDSFGSEYPRGGGYQQSIGFANALSHAIIREDSAQSIESFDDPGASNPLLEDETLELAGAPWAKEGSLKHKQHLEAVDKRAKDRNWNECFAVIQRGWLRLFSFNASTKSMRLKAKQRQNGGVVVGGGNWMENAEEVWKFLLRQTIASALPPPGYSKSRPHVWALSLPTGAVHLFQVGTAEIVKEFVTTANYWSARLSKQPLVGGVSSMEYGWGDGVINTALVHMDKRSPPNSSGAPRPSIQSSIRSSLDQQGSVRAKLPADRVHLSDWTPPQQTMNASNLSEADQLSALQNYVKNVEEELQKHNELRSAMVLSFSPRHPNATKAMANWERKSSYLLREIVKFRTYIDCLQAAKVQKDKLYASRTEEKETDIPPTTST